MQQTKIPFTEKFINFLKELKHVKQILTNNDLNFIQIGENEEYIHPGDMTSSKHTQIKYPTIILYNSETDDFLLIREKEPFPRFSTFVGTYFEKTGNVALADTTISHKGNSPFRLPILCLRSKMKPSVFVEKKFVG